MKTELHLQSSPAVASTVFKLAIVGGVLLGCVLMILELCASALQVLR
jgi:hypothetical protein